MSFIIQFRRNTAAFWTSANPVLRAGELVLELDSGKAKMGDGATAWNALPYWQPSGPDIDTYTVDQVTGAAPLASPAFTGLPTAPTQAPGDNTTKIATDAFVTAAVGVEAARAQSAEGLALAKASNLADLAARQTALNTLAGAVTSAQYLRGDGTNVSMSAIQASDLPTANTSVKGAVRIDGIDADITAAPGAGSAGSSGIVADAKHVHPSPTVFAPTGLTGATAASRYAGATASGAPASGTFALGDIVIDQAGSLRICTTAGSPGSWGKLAQLTGNAGNIQPSPGTAAAGSVSVGADAGHVHGQPPMFAPTGLTGATAASRYVGAVASGSPASGTFVVGDFSVDQAGAMWICTVGGSPGTWVKLPHRDSNPADIQPLGTQAAGATGTAADAGHVHPDSAGWTLADQGFLAWTFDPAAAASTSAAVAGTLYLERINIRSGITATILTFQVTSAGSGASTGSFIGLYNSAGTLLSGSADIASSLTATGVKQIALTTPQSLSGGTFVWAAVITNLASTQPSMMKSASFGQALNANMTTSLARTATNGTGLTSLPATITPSSNVTNVNNSYWFAIS